MYRVAPAVLTFLIVWGVQTCRAAEPAAPAAAKPELTRGATSIDQLLDAFLAAVQAKDEQALTQLRVDHREYRDIIIPGTVKPGQPPRNVPDETAEFFWSMINQKSLDVGYALLKNFGGHKYTRKEVSYTKGTREFGWYKAHGDVRLELVDEQGAVRELHTGAIAEVDGHYKFIGFNSNN